VFGDRLGRFGGARGRYRRVIGAGAEECQQQHYDAEPHRQISCSGADLPQNSTLRQPPHHRPRESAIINSPAMPSARSNEFMKNDDRSRNYRKDTLLTHLGRHPEAHHGAVNPPVYHASTILSANMAE
jgi:hypothetical protein